MNEILSVTLQLQNRKGLHARAAAKFVKTSEMYRSEITVSRGEISVSALSLMGLMMLVAHCGTQITIQAKGHDAQEALDDLTKLLDDKFGED